MTTTRVKAQDAVFSNSGTWTSTNFLNLHPNFPLTLSSASALRLGFNYTPFAHRMVVYGGGIRNSWQSDITGKPWSSWQEQMKFSLYQPTVGPPFLFTPGIRYLANRHNWSGYQAIYGLRERVSNFNVLNIETGMYVYAENSEPKDAVITFSYPNNVSDPNKSRLIFETIALDTIQNTAGIGDLQTELATLTHRGNFGFRTAAPQARIEIMGTAGLIQNSNNQAKAISVINDNSESLFLVTTANNGSLLGFGTNEPNAKINVVGNGGLSISSSVRPRVLSVVDDNNDEKVVLNNGYNYTNAQNNVVYRPASFWLNKPIGSSLDVELYAGGSTWLQSPIKYDNNNQAVAGSELILEGNGIYSNTTYGNKMSTELLGNSFTIKDYTNQYLNLVNGEVYMNVLKTTAGISYLTVNSSGQIQKSSSFPDPNKAWSFEGNNYGGSDDLILGTLAGSTKDEFDIYLNGTIIGKYDTRVQDYPGFPGYFNTGSYSYKGHYTIGGMATLAYPPLNSKEHVTLTLIGTNKWSDMYQPIGAPDWEQGAVLFEGYKPLVNLNMNQTSIVKTSSIFQNGMVEFGEFVNSSGSSGTYTNPIRFNSIISLGKIITGHTVKYSIASYKNGDWTDVSYAFGYNTPIMYLGKSEIKDISGTSGTNPEKLEVKGALIPKVNGSYNLGSSSNSWDDVWAKGSNIATSDRRLKKNISKLEYGLKEILQLNPVTYYYLNYNQNKNLRIGFIAQELDSIMPNTVVVGSETDSSYLGVRYEEIIPILTKAIQEQQVIIEGQKKEIEIIQSKLNSVGFLTRNDSNDVLNKEPILFQNTPNPFSNITFIDYFIPETCKQASIIVIDGAGSMVYSYSINSRGMGRVTLEDTKISHGNYFYSLHANGRLIDTKQLSVVKQ
jgi:hypothetical protein